MLYFWQNAGARSFVAMELEPRLRWSAAEYLLADLVDLLQGLCFGLAGRKGKKPRPLPRPTRKSARPGGAVPVDLNARIANLKGGGGGG